MKLPITDKPLVEINDYQGLKGKGVSFSSYMRDEGAFYAPYQGAGYREYWSSNITSQYMPVKINSAEQALDEIDKFQFPVIMRQESLRAARFLSGIFEKVASPKIVYDLVAGRIDRRKIPKMAMASAAGNYDVDVIRPYKKFIPAPAKLPVVALVADACNMKMWNAEYIPKVLRITLGILWACQANNLQAYACLMEGYMTQHTKLKEGYVEAVWAHVFSEPQRTIPLNYYATMLHREIWRNGGIQIEAADKRFHNKLEQIQGYTADGYFGSSFPSGDGGNSVTWARNCLQADIVISIGNVRDRTLADIDLDEDFSVEVACQQIALQSKKLRRS